MMVKKKPIAETATTVFIPAASCEICAMVVGIEVYVHLN